MYNVIEAWLTPSKFTRPQTQITPKGIVVHWVANPMSTALGNRNYFETIGSGVIGSDGNYIYASAHEVINLNGDIVCCVPSNEMCYHAGSATYTNAYWNKYGMSPNKCMYGIECTHIDWTGKMYDATYNTLVERCADLCIKWNLDPMYEIWTHQEVVGWKDCHRWFVNNPSEWLLFKQKVANRINLIKNPTPVYPQWQLDCVTWLKNNGYIASPHNPDENVTFTLFGYMMNNKWTKLNPIQPIDYLTQYGYIKNWHDGNELISMKTFGYIVSNKLKETITTTPIDYLLSKGIITQPRNPDETVNFWLLGAMLSNANKKGIRI